MQDQLVRVYKRYLTVNLQPASVLFNYEALVKTKISFMSACYINNQLSYIILKFVFI